jgi:hypothetical protein
VEYIEKRKREGKKRREKKRGKEKREKKGQCFFPKLAVCNISS